MATVAIVFHNSAGLVSVNVSPDTLAKHVPSLLAVKNKTFAQDMAVAPALPLDALATAHVDFLATTAALPLDRNAQITVVVVESATLVSSHASARTGSPATTAVE